jgi:hypothetical protein
LSRIDGELMYSAYSLDRLRDSGVGLPVPMSLMLN